LTALGLFAAVRATSDWKSGWFPGGSRAVDSEGCRGRADSKIQPERLLGCPVARSDTAAAGDPVPFWGKIDCEEDSRHRRITSDGDPHPTSTGSPQGDSSFRRLTVRDGDRVYGERCELGLNRSEGPTALYREGDRAVTFISLRLPEGTDVNGPYWRTVTQMKQAQTYRNPDPSPVLELQVVGRVWFVNISWDDAWETPAEQNTWTRFAFDVTYSQDPTVGSIKIYVDLNGDGDAADSGEQSPTIHSATLRAETDGSGPSDFSVGESIPDHLRAGIYHDPDYSCPTGCSVDVDNVQIVEP
jgi:hypothetical protein